MNATADQFYEKLALIASQREVKADYYDGVLLAEDYDKFFEDISWSVERLIEESRTVHINPNTVRRELMNIAILAQDQLDSFDEGEFVETLVSKHRLYGSKPLVKYGMMGVLIKLDTKVERLVKLLGPESLTNDTSESAKDTLTDLVGYCVLGLIFMKYWNATQ